MHFTHHSKKCLLGHCDGLIVKRLRDTVYNRAISLTLTYPKPLIQRNRQRLFSFYEKKNLRAQNIQANFFQDVCKYDKCKE